MLTKATHTCSVGLLLLTTMTAASPRLGSEAFNIQEGSWARRRKEQTATRLYTEGRAALNAGHSREALAKFQETLKLLQELFERDNVYEVLGLTGVAQALEALGRIGEALPIYKKALAISQRLFEGDNVYVATSLNNVGAALLALARAGEALSLFEESLAMRQRLFPRGHPDIAVSLNNIGFALGKLGRPSEALLMYEQAFAMRQRFPPMDAAETAKHLNNVGMALHDLGRAQEALSKYDEALAIQQRLFEDDHPDIAMSLNNTAAALQSLGRVEDALLKHEEALAMSRRLFEEDHPHTATSLSNVAGALYALGRASEALSKYLEALRMRRSIFEEDHPDIATSLNDVGVALQAFGRAEEAVAKFQEALAMSQRLFKADHADVAANLDNLGGALDEVGRADQALSNYQESLAMSRRLFNGDHPDIAKSLSSVGAALRRRGREREALSKYEEALAMQRRIFKGDHPDVAITLSNVAIALIGLERSGKALRKLEEALAAARRLRMPELYAIASTLGWLHLDQGRARQAERAFEEAIMAIERARARVGGDDLERASFFAQASARWNPFNGMVQTQLALGRADKGLEFLERGRARGFLDVLERGQRMQGRHILSPVEEAARAARDEHLLMECQAISQMMGAAESSMAQRTGELTLLRQRMDVSANQKKAAIDAGLVRLSEAEDAYQEARRRGFNLLQNRVSFDLKPKTARELQALLAGTERLLIYSVSAQRGLVFVVPPSGESIRAEELLWQNGAKVTEHSLMESVVTYLDGIEAEGRLARGLVLHPEEFGKFELHEQSAKGHRLFRALVPSSVWKEIGSSGRVYVVPHGVLQTFPFEALVVRASSTTTSYWLDDGPAVVYGSSGTVLLGRAEARAEQQKRRAQGSRLERMAVVLADPIYERDAKNGGEAPPRNGVRVEAVSKGSLAERLGIRPGAVVTAYGERPVRSIEEFDRVLHELLMLERDAHLESVPRLRVWQAGDVFERDVAASEKLGATLGELDPSRSLVERFGYRNRYDSLVSLPGTRLEAQNIFEALRGKRYQEGLRDDLVPLLMGNDATRRRLWELTPSSRFVHLATHGLINDDARVSYSSLALTVPEVPSAEDYGFLTLLDLFDHWWGRLRDAELVVLSACETQRGVIRDQEAVYGLTWGFMYAGAPAVIASLWRVDDVSTAELMGSFYRALVSTSGQPEGPATTDKLGAFLQARQLLKKRYPQAYFWAPFIYLGEPN